MFSKRTPFPPEIKSGLSSVEGQNNLGVFGLLLFIECCCGLILQQLVDGRLSHYRTGGLS